ncbi:MAG: cysteine synthase CysM [Saprospiraceae bacterium]
MGIIDLIGNTPMVQLRNEKIPKGVSVYAKLEGHNPGGSVKDRAALGMITGALEKKKIRKGDKLVEATSGNTGIALAMIAQLKGLYMTLVMTDGATKERIETMKAFGAKVVLTPQEKTIEYSREFAEKMAKEDGYFMLDQFSNPDNYGIHYRTTGPEIWKDTKGKITHFVSAMGTTGTIMGVSRYLKEKNQKIQIVGTQPEDGSRIPGIRRWSPEFLPNIFEANRIDRTIDVNQQDAKKMTQWLAKQEGIFAGMSSGGAATAALAVAKELSEGVIVFIACDKGDRYLSTDLFR